MKKRLISAMSAAILLLGLCLLPAGAESTASGTWGDHITWRVENETLIISGSGVMEEAWFFAEYPWYDYWETFDAVVVESGITEIANGAFKRNEFSSLTIADTVTVIGEEAFSSNISLTSVDLPDSIRVIEDSAFEDCIYLEQVRLSAALERIGASAFYDCGFLKSLTIPELVTSIGQYAFDGCSVLTIYGVSGSAAERAASADGIPFRDVNHPGDNIPQDPTDGGDTAAFHGFTDVTAADWFYLPVNWAVVNQVTSGTAAGIFSPEMECSRAQIVTFLWNRAGQPEPEHTENPFVDVKTTDWYYKAVLWAVENHITAGMTDTTFAPDAVCSRAQAVTFLYNQQGRPVVTGNTPFADVKAGEWYETPVLWAVEQGITAGMGDGTFGTNNRCTRAQIVTFLWNQAGKQVAYLDDSNPSASLMVNQILVGDRVISLGQRAEELGIPEEMLPSGNGFDWYVYGTDTYEDFFAAGIKDGKVIVLQAVGSGFGYQGMSWGSQAAAVASSNYEITVSTDDYLEDKVFAVQLALPGTFGAAEDQSSRSLHGECKLIFHMTNAFRVAHGRKMLKWSDQATTAAQLHSEDMAENFFFSHGNRNNLYNTDRLTAQGVAYSYCGENLYRFMDLNDYGDGYRAFAGWVNSEDHRNILLKNRADALGIGGAVGMEEVRTEIFVDVDGTVYTYQTGGRLCYYYTQSFYQEAE